ncbi:unnamed protein product, partial [Ectocarpus sp. 13 AM-2016]
FWSRGDVESALRAVRSGKAAGAVGRPKGSSNSSKRASSAAKKETKAGASAATAAATTAAATAATASASSAAASAAKKKASAGAKRVAAQSTAATTVAKKPAARKKPKRSRPGRGVGGGGLAVELGGAAESTSDEDPRFWDKAGDGESESEDRDKVGTEGGGGVDADCKGRSWCGAAGASSSVFDFRRDHPGEKRGGSGKRSSGKAGLAGSPRPDRRDRVGIHADFMMPRECDDWAASMRDTANTPSKKPNLTGSSTDTLSPIALETKLIASYDAGSDSSILPTLSPFSQTSRLGYASPSRDGGGGQFGRSLLSPPRSAGKLTYGSGGGGRVWSSSPNGPATLGSHAGNSSTDSLEAARFSLSPFPRSCGGLRMPHLRDKAWASPVRGDHAAGREAGHAEERDRKGVAKDNGPQQQGLVGGGLPTPSKSPRSRDWKAAVGDSEKRFFAAAAAAANARDGAAAAITPEEAREMAAKRSGRVGGGDQRQSPSSPGDPFGSWGRRERGGFRDDARDVAAGKDREAHRVETSSSWSCDKNKQEREDTTPPGVPRNPKCSGTRAPSHTTPSPPATSTDGSDADDTLQAAASLVSFQKPRVGEAPRLKGPLGTSALRVTLGTPVVSTGTPSISSSVQAKLSLPKTSPPRGSPSFPARETGGGGRGGAGRGAGAGVAAGLRDPMETAYRAAGLEVGSRAEGGGGQGSSSSSSSLGASAEAVKRKSGPSNGMFDAVSPTASVQESGTPYSVCRVDRKGRPNATPLVAASTDQKTENGSSSGSGSGSNSRSGAGSAESSAKEEASAAGTCGAEPLCHTPLKPAAACRAAAPGAAARASGWSGSVSGPWATPPPMAMNMTIGTPCSGSKFRSADDDEESDYSDYETYCSVKPTPSKRVLSPPSATKRLFADVGDAETSVVRR